MKNIYIGQIIEQRLKELNMPIKQFADMIGYHRTSVYSILKQKSIDTELLIKISKALDYDFYNKVYGSKKKKKKKQQIYVGGLIPEEYLKNINIPEGFLLVVKSIKKLPELDE